MLEVGDETTVEVNIIDADVDDTHDINASSDDTRIANVSANKITLTVIGVTAGIAAITVSSPTIADKTTLRQYH